MCRWDNILFSDLHMNHQKKMEIGSKWDASIVMEVPVFLSNKSWISAFNEKTKNCLVIVLLLERIIVGNFCLAFHLFCPVISVISAEEETGTKQFFSCGWAAVCITQIIFKCLFSCGDVLCHSVHCKGILWTRKEVCEAFILWFCGRWSFGREKLQESKMLRMKQGTSSSETRRD